MRGNLKNKGKLRKTLCFIAVLMIMASLIITAVAQTSQDVDANCSNHTEHDETCGYIAASDEIPCDMDCETTEDGEVVHADGCAYTAAVEGSSCTHSCELCDQEEMELESTDSAASNEIGDGETSEDSEGEDSQSQDSDESGQQALITTLSNGEVYDIEISASISDTQETMDLVRETTGTLSISVSLPQGETGRYVDIYLPNYGMAFSSTLPSAGGDITKVEKLTRSVTVGGVSNTVEYLRLTVSDTIDSTLNIQVGYVTSTISDALDALWGETGTLPATGFQVSVYNGSGTELARKTYGSWVPKNIDTDDAFTVVSGVTSYITNYPEIPNSYADSSTQRYYVEGRWYMQISLRNLYSSSYEVRREDLESVKIYVPDPEVAVVTEISVTISSSSIDVPTLESFDDAELKKDSEGYYYELNFDEDNSYRVDYNNKYIYIYVYLKKADGSTAQAGEELGTYKMVLTTRTYGDQTNTYETTYTPQMRTERVMSEYYSSSYHAGYYLYQYYGGTNIPATVTTSGPSSAHTIESGTTGGSDVMGVQRSGIYTITSTYDRDQIYPILKGSTEEWTFPYVIQPTRLTCYISNSNYSKSFSTIIESLDDVSDIDDVLEVNYETSDGGTHTASLSLSSDGYYLYIDFDDIPDGGRVVSVSTEWKQWVQYYTSVDVTLTYDVPSTDEDGKALVGGTMYQVTHLWKDANGETITDSTVAAGMSASSSYTHIWFMVKQEYCPQLTWSGGNSTYTSLDGVIMSDTDTYTDTGTLKVNSSHTNAGDYMDTVTNPKIKLGISLSASYSGGLTGWGTDIQTTSMFLTGKMTVMPFLAGWTVTYTTALTDGDQTYTIPELSEWSSEEVEEGLAIEIPIAEGDRFTSVLVFSKEGSVSGWKDYPELIKNVEYALYRTDAEGNSVIANATYPSYAESYVHRAELYAYFCSDSCAGNDGTHTGLSSNIYNTSTSYHMYVVNYLVDFVYNVVVTIGSVSSSYSSVSVDELYQAGEGTLSVAFRNSVSLGGGATSRYWGSYSYYNTTSSLIKILKNYYGMSVYNSQYNSSYLRATFPYEGSSPTFYVQLLTNDVTYMYAAIETTFGYPTTTSGAAVEFVTGNDGSTWLKITPDETALSSAAADYYSSYYSYITWSLETLLYAIPGATTETYDVIGDIYLDLHVQELEGLYNGENEDYPYYYLKFEGLVADELGLLGDGDTTTERLYKLSNSTGTTVKQNIFSGVQIYPGSTSSGYENTTRAVEIYNHDAENLLAQVQIAAGNEDLRSYKVIVEIPKAGESVPGTLLDSSGGSGSGQTVTSQIDMWLTGPVTLYIGGQIQEVTVTYRIGDDTYVNEEDVEDWSLVEAICIEVDELPALTAVTMIMPMRMDPQTVDDDGKISYIGASYSYISSSSLESQGTCVLAQYVFHTYKLSGVVWYDPNEDGARSTSEEGQADVTLTVKRSDGTPVAETQTDESGAFSFELVEGEDLYIEITLPDGYVLTKESSETDMTASATDSDFNRTTNTLTLPTLTTEFYANISAGLVKLPVITASDITVVVGKTAEATASAQWDYGEATLYYEEAEETQYATVDYYDGTVTGVAEGETEATVWMVNTLGDRVEAKYKITVVQNPVSFTLTKTLTAAADEDQTFVFQVTDSSGNSFYVTLTVSEGEISASVNVVDLTPGEYTVRELDTNWRYTNTGLIEQTQDLTDSEEEYTFTFTNEKANSQWLSGKAKVTNTMSDTE